MSNSNDPLKDFKILVLDDDSEIRQYIRALLECRFPIVLEAGNTKAALDLLKAEKVDVVISDIHLPGGDGVEFFHMVRALELPHAKIIFITGDTRYSRKEALASGAYDFFYKPFNSKDLIDSIAKVIGKVMLISEVVGGDKSLASALENEGYYVREIAIDEVQEISKNLTNFDVIYFDLPDYEHESKWQSLIAEARKSHSAFDLPVVMACNQDNWEIMRQHDELSINELLPTFFDERYCLTRIRQYIVSKKRDEELRSSRNQALETAQLKSVFLANMSHEIRTPLNGVIGVVGMLEKSKLDKEQTEFVGIIHKSGLRLQRILNDILDFSKIESKNVTLEQEVFDLYDLIHQVQTLFFSIAAAKNIYVKYEIDPKVPRYVKSDSLRVQQILSNFVNNSIKFTAVGGVTIQVKLRSQMQTTKVGVAFEVIDTGIGLTQEEIQRLFKSFSQANYSTQKVYGGTGLGLSICKQLVTLFEGDLGVHSVKGQGSTFWFALPFIEATPEEASAFQANETSRQKAESEKVDYSKKRILVVDDDEVNRRVIEKMLEKTKVASVYAESGKMALEVLGNSEKIDLILLDCHMPEWDGYETMEKIKEKFASSLPPVIALTADAFKENRIKCLEAGMVDVLTKPIDLATIQKAIHKWMS